MTVVVAVRGWREGRRDWEGKTVRGWLLANVREQLNFKNRWRGYFISFGYIERHRFTQLQWPRAEWCGMATCSAGFLDSKIYLLMRTVTLTILNSDKLVLVIETLPKTLDYYIFILFCVFFIVWTSYTLAYGKKVPLSFIIKKINTWLKFKFLILIIKKRNTND